MIPRPSLTTVFSGIFIAYMANSLWSIGSLYLPPSCEKNCLKNGLLHTSDFKNGMRFVLLSTENPRPASEKEMSFISAFDVTDVNNDFSQEITVKANKNALKRNATQYLAIFSLPIDPKSSIEKAKTKYNSWIRSTKSTFSLISLTKYHVPEAETFQLLGQEENSEKPSKNEKSEKNKRVPVLHLKSKIKMGVMTDSVDIARDNIPGEVHHLFRMNQDDKKTYLPMIFIDELSMRLRDLVKINKTDEQVTFHVEYSPISFGKLRLFNQFQASLGGLHGMGFTEKDTDEVKGIFADTNLFLLLVTFGVSAVHLLFDFLAFKNDISFWRNRTTMEGLSTTTILWRAFSQSIIFLYLWDEETSLLVLIPSGIGALIEMWKVCIAYRVKLVKPEGSWFYRPCLGEKQSQAEEMTGAYDSESLKYLSYLLYPLCIGGAFYSLFYTPHKSWYSWTISSLVNGVYAFGFLFMLPQLFVNYKLKSVAHLPWRAFMYKAFNTFIDDLFAFIITMPTAHRVACFRDDLVFVVYLYQRYLYPVDKKRIDMSGMIEETTEEVSDQVADNDVPAKESEGLTRRKPKKD